MEFVDKKYDKGCGYTRESEETKMAMIESRSQKDEKKVDKSTGMVPETVQQVKGRLQENGQMKILKMCKMRQMIVGEKRVVETF